MPKKYYRIDLGEGLEIHVHFVTASGLITDFVVKLLLLLDDRYYEVIRYDSAHNCPHKDVLDNEGKVIRKVWFELLDNKEGLNLAIKDLKDNCQLYAERFERWVTK
jgi:hypothetical protein